MVSRCVRLCLQGLVFVHVADSKNDLDKLVISIMDIVSNHGNYAMWSDPTQRVHTASARMDADLRVILHEFKKRKELGQTMPKHLLVVEDSAPDNKNKNRQMLFSLLVKEDIFLSVQILYLLVGHTHWRVDQIFSVLSRKVKEMHGGLMTFEDLEHLLRDVYTDWLDGRQNFVEEVRDIPDLNVYLDRVCHACALWEFVFLNIRFEKNGPSQNLNV